MNDTTLLLRQIHPSFVQAGRVTSQAFTPTPKDDRRLSMYDGDQISAVAAYEHYTVQLKYQSVGIFGVNVKECLDLDLGVKADPEPYPEHVVVDFGDRAANAIKSIGKELREKAQARGWQHQSGH